MPLNFFFEYEEGGELKKELATITPLHRLAFAASICERLLPNYNAFVRGFKGNPEVLRNALDKVWEIAGGSPADENEIHQLIKNCRDIPPQEDDDCEIYAYEASMTVSVICYALKACLDPTPKLIFQVAEISGDIISETVFIEKEDADPDWYKKNSFTEQYRQAAIHPFSVRERTKQNETFQQLKDTATLDDSFLKYLKETSNPNKKSSTGLY